MKILMLAETCNPEWASLPSFSFYLAKSIADHVDVVLVTHVRNKSAIENSEKGRLQIVYVDNEYIAKPLHKVAQFLQRIKIGGWMTSMALKYPSYVAFEYHVWRRFKAELKAGEFDYVHRISPVSPTIPSPLAKWSPVPFIYGPINGGLPWPGQFTEEIKKEREFLVHFRNFYRYLPYYKSTFKYSAAILSAFKHVQADIPRADLTKAIKFDELGVYADFYKPAAHPVKKKDGICQFLFVGRLVPYKCPDVVIHAFAQSDALRNKHKLIIVGDGPERKNLQQLIEKHELSECVRLVGWKGQNDVAKIMQESDVFVFPTIREVGGNVIVEAMASGLPCIVPDYGGPSELINEKVGIKVALMKKEIFINSFAKNMEMLAENENVRLELGKQARIKVLNEYDWQEKGKLITSIYTKLRGNSRNDYSVKGP
ncbi:glycosyltransferase family 4 protein [Methylobacter sp. YRD-M1]|uniref:glycosyltransferase family 4 protein n=1 Tax=Methylobacter sp. YRD-M1 TaxID=2911520 RepID=UPI00227BF0E9|nr:glycosyltransferase family 4 protein [Methylobacter sp. YRD-M1]WAK01147.1 glycosyltransferase family 4 protein [Methylobacter sp. YRD-M1]